MSRQTETTESNVTKAKQCSLCEGTGIESDRMCRKCHGNGFVKMASTKNAITAIAAIESNSLSNDDISKLLEDLGPSDEIVTEPLPETQVRAPKVEVSYEGTGDEHPLPLGQAANDARLKTNIAAMLSASSDRAIGMVYDWVLESQKIPPGKGQPDRWTQLERIYQGIEKMSGEQLLQAYTFVRNTE